MHKNLQNLQQWGMIAWNGKKLWKLMSQFCTAMAEGKRRLSIDGNFLSMDIKWTKHYSQLFQWPWKNIQNVMIIWKLWSWYRVVNLTGIIAWYNLEKLITLIISSILFPEILSFGTSFFYFFVKFNDWSMILYITFSFR